MIGCSKALKAICAVLLFSTNLFALAEFGVGITSTTSGHAAPALAGGLRFSDWVLIGSSVGVSNKYYYHSAYSISAMKVWNSGIFIWGNTESGFGFGIYYAKRGFQDLGETKESVTHDFAAGPAFRVKFWLAEPLYIQIDNIFGLRSLSQILTMQGQTNTVLSLGVTL
jgi:hypothetical protein